MLAILSHDVKEPVNMLKAVMSMFNQGQLPEQELRPLTQQIEAQAGSISLLVDNVLLWVKMQISGIDISLETFLLADWVNPHLDLYAIQAKSRGIMVVSQISPEIRVKSDKQVVSLVIRNLISNAIKFANKNSEVEVISRVLEKGILLSVVNTGQGLTSEQVQAVFQKSKSLDSKDSTGLGLKLCRSYLLAMDTDFEIMSIPNQKTTISVLLKV
jgi:signal transduction histidine kinase